MNFDKLVTVNWYPGHMLKAQREIREKLKLVDCIVELVDARAPKSTTNTNLADVLINKGHVRVLAKSDLADQDVTNSWLTSLREDGVRCLSLHHRQKQAGEKLCKMIVQAADDQRHKAGATTPRLRAVRAMIIGVPNVGKSSLINALVNRKRAKTGPMPGVTRHQQWVKLGTDLELLDTPGVMLPRIASPETGLKMGLVACIKDSVVGEELLSEYLLYQLDNHRLTTHLDRYRIEPQPNVQAFLDAMGHSCGYLRQAGTVEIKLVALHFLRDFREGRLGTFSLETANG
jgi:ribosome biogenesis GTPase A